MSERKRSRVVTEDSGLGVLSLRLLVVNFVSIDPQFPSPFRQNTNKDPQDLRLF